MIEILKDVMIVLGAPIARSIFGWAEHAFNDNKITKFEVKQLLSTVIRVGALGLMGYIGMSVAGIDNAALASMAGAFLGDKVLHAFGNY